MKAQEQAKPENAPSMDEILQSIRGVINEDSTEENKASNNKDEDVLELTEVAETVSNTSAVSSPIIPAASVTEPAPTVAAASITAKTESTAAITENPIPSANAKTEPKPQEEAKIANIEQNLPPAQPVAESKTESAKKAVSDANNTASPQQPAPEAVSTNATATQTTEAPATNNTQSGAQESIAQTSAILTDTEDSSMTSETKDTEGKQKSHLVSDKVANEATSAIKDLMTKAFKPNHDGLKFRSGTTVEELVIETIKPYLSHWLDENLPSIVKTLVEKEIKKLMPNDD
jgi:cell pole-organizing protein PopZ